MKELFNVKLGNIILIVYIIVSILVRIMNISNESNSFSLILIFGLLLGIALRIIGVIIFWKSILVRHIYDKNRISIIPIIIGYLLILLAISPLSIHNNGFTESYIVISIAIILNNKYHVCINRNTKETI